MDAEKKIQEHQNVIIVFYTQSNASSFIIGELVRELEREYGGRIKVLLMDADDSTHYSETYRIKKIPTLVFIKKGEVITTLQGISTRAEIIDSIKAVFFNNK
ncbi:hypothetical protein GF407_14975 [candidate division KSB1 bacterium]|nr:hypothetical protein [candidate division KSB1 bacterium]